MNEITNEHFRMTTSHSNKALDEIEQEKCQREHH